MTVVPPEWSEPDSRLGVYYELFWIGLAIVGFGALAYWELFSITIAVTPQRLASATLLGVTLGIAVTYGSFVSERVQRLWETSRIRFAALFVFAIGVQLGLDVAPTWTVLTMLAFLLTLIPLRVAVYFRTR